MTHAAATEVRPERARIVVAGLALASLAAATMAEEGKSVAASLGVYVFPAANQAAEQQATDEAACYQWAAGQTGTDPRTVAQQQAANQQQAQADQQAASQAGKDATKGAGVKGAARGAAAGAIIGEIADDDAGKGAAYGAAAGAVAGRRQARKAQSQAQAQAESQAAAQAEQRDAATEEQLANFRKAFGACLEGKQYAVKF